MVLQEIQKDCKFKRNKIKPPDFYLGGNINRKELNGKRVWIISSRNYTKLSVENIEKRVEKRDML